MEEDHGGHVFVPLPPPGRVIAPDTLVGTLAPDFSLPDSAGQTRSLAAERGKWVVLAFYPVVVDPSVRQQNRAISEASEQLTAAKAVAFGISAQDAANQKQMASVDHLRHALLADAGGKTAAAYRVQGNRNGFAERVTVYVAPDGVIAYVDENVRPQTAGNDALANVARLAKTWVSGKIAPRPAPPLLAAGGPAAGLRLPEAASGRLVSLDDLRAGRKALVVLFVSTQCPCSNSYNARYVSLARTYAAQNVSFVGVYANASEGAAKIAAHAKKHGFTFPVLRDAGARTADKLGAQSTPEAVVLDAAGRVAYHGALDDSINPASVSRRYLTDALDALLAGRRVPVPATRGFGCAIEHAPPDATSTKAATAK